MTQKLLVSVDVESDGPCPGLYSMVSFGAVVVEPALDRTFKGVLAPLPGAHMDPVALAVSGIAEADYRARGPRPECSPPVVMDQFRAWLLGLRAERLTFVSDNPAFDWQFINYYCYAFGSDDYAQANPFGHSARRIGDLWAGHRGKFNDHSSWKDLRKTRHTHDPVDDAKGNAEALLEIMARLEQVPKCTCDSCTGTEEVEKAE